jgi:hypothetical protein
MKMNNLDTYREQVGRRKKERTRERKKERKKEGKKEDNRGG